MAVRSWLLPAFHIRCLELTRAPQYNGHHLLVQSRDVRMDAGALFGCRDPLGTESDHPGGVGPVESGLEVLVDVKMACHRSYLRS